MYTLGLDIGSTASKAVILKDGEHIISISVIDVGTGSSGPKKVIDDVLFKSNLTREDLHKVVVTGYGRMTFKDADKQLSELSCHSKGANFLIPEAKTIIDIGGQDAKILKIDKTGKLINFIMNDKCAAGTGRFLDVMAKVLEVKVDELADLSSKSEETVNISSTCTVFAESEVISHLARGAKKEDICFGIHKSIAKRVSGLAQRVVIEKDLVMTGGVANNKGVVKAIENELKQSIKVPENPQIVGALGAALFAYKLI